MKIQNVFLFICLYFLWAYPCRAEEMIRYAALGDSYTIGTGALPAEAWPSLLTASLQAKGLPIKLVGNLGRNGWTAREVIDVQLLEFKRLKADFATLLIGTNDWVHGVPAQVFHDHLNIILDELKPLVQNGRLIVLTIPDFSVTPVGQEYSSGRDITEGIRAFNAIIADECAKRDIRMIDLFSLSKEFVRDSSLISTDRLHPSAKGYARWEEFMEPQIYQYLIESQGAHDGSESAKR